MSSIYERSFFSFCIAGAAALTLAVTASTALAQGHTGGKGSGHDAGSTSHDDGHSSHEGGSGKGKGGKGGRESGRGKGGGHQSLQDVFRDMEDEAHSEATKGKKGKGASVAPKGKTAAPKGKKADAEVAEDSDRPPWAGGGDPGPGSKPGRPNPDPGIKKGGIYGDMYIIERDADGLPILDDNGYVKVKYYDADGVLQCCFLRDDEGNLIPITLADGTLALPIEVELGRLSVGRSPERVLSAQYDEVIKLLNSADSVELDAAGRIIVVVDGEKKTIDSPLSNLAIYYELIYSGTLTGLTPEAMALLAANVDLEPLTDGTWDGDDLAIAASLFAAASDKTIPVTVDTIAYMNAILKLATYVADEDPDTIDFVDYTTLTYDRAATYSGELVTILVEQPDGTWKPTEVDVYVAVFGSTQTTATNIDAFTTAADDARLVINFIHEYSVPTATTN